MAPAVNQGRDEGVAGTFCTNSDPGAGADDSYVVLNKHQVAGDP